MKVTTVSGSRAPEPQHRSSIIASPKEDDIPRQIAVCKLQPNNARVERLRCSGVRNRKMCFIQYTLARPNEAKIKATATESERWSK